MKKLYSFITIVSFSLICLLLTQSSYSQVYSPELIYYKFENNVGLTTPNFATAPVGTNPAPLSGTTLFSTGGQFDTCIIGNGASNGGVVSGWNTSLGSGSWTISMWVSIPTDPSGSAYYIFGDPGAGSFRCFHNGVAGPDSLLLRGTGITEVRVPGTGPAPSVVHFVYDATASVIRAYKNGVLIRTVPQTPLNMPTGSGFKVGGYSSSATFKGKLDEFRIYNRALSPGEIAATWNQQLPIGPVVLFYDQFPNLVNWTATNNGGTCVWQIFNPPYPNTYTLPATSSGPIVGADADNCGTGSTTLTTLTLANNLNCMGRENIAIEWDNDWRHQDAQDIARAQVSYNGGVTWVTIVEWAGVSKRNTHEIHMLPGAVNNPNVKVRFVSIQPGWDWWWAIDNVKISADVIVNVKTVSNELPDDYSLSQNYPNPFNPKTSIDFSIPEPGMVTLKVYDMLGKEISTLVEDFKNAGTYTVEFDGSDVSSGTYFYRIQTGEYIKVKRMMLVK